MSIVGHANIVASLEKTLHPVSLFYGPASVGKWTTAEHLRHRNKISAGDLLRVKKLTASSARELVAFSATAPTQAEGKLAIIRLDDATPAALHTLLKTLEAAEPTNRFILIAEQLPLETVASRCHNYRFGLLFPDEVAEVLVTRKNFKPDQAAVWAERAGGQVMRALNSSRDIEAKPLILIVLRAFRERDAKLLDTVADKWTDALTELLALWCHESITKQWRIFSEAESEFTGVTLQLNILSALRANIRPRLVVRSSLMTVLKGL